MSFEKSLVRRRTCVLYSRKRSLHTRGILILYILSLARLTSVFCKGTYLNKTSHLMWSLFFVICHNCMTDMHHPEIYSRLAHAMFLFYLEIQIGFLSKPGVSVAEFLP